jgi:hypothetical protein
MKILLSLALIIVYSLFTIKYQARQKTKLLIEINLAIKEEKDKIQLLETDFAHRTRPQVIRQRLVLLPNLKPTDPSQVIIVKED